MDKRVFIVLSLGLFLIFFANTVLNTSNDSIDYYKVEGRTKIINTLPEVLLGVVDLDTEIDFDTLDVVVKSDAPENLVLYDKSLDKFFISYNFSLTMNGGKLDLKQMTLPLTFLRNPAAKRVETYLINSADSMIEEEDHKLFRFADKNSYLMFSVMDGLNVLVSIPREGINISNLVDNLSIQPR